MLTQRHRFHGHNSLHYVYQHGKTVRDTLCSLRYSPNPRRGTYRAAIVVSKKMNKSAVVRNRIRRRIYEILRQHVSPEAAYDLVITAFSDQLAELPSPELEGVIRVLLERAGVPLLAPRPK